MNDFWNNISRYPRFFISSLVGLILVILAPIKNFLKTFKLRIILFILILTLATFTYLILRNMLAL